MSRQITATISLSANDKETLMEYAKSNDLSLSRLLVNSAFDVMDMRKVTIHHDGTFILIPLSATPEDLGKAASMLGLLKGEVK